MKFHWLSIMLLMFAISFSANAQEENLLNDENLTRIMNRSVVPSFQTTEVKGTPYMNDEWTRGHIIINDQAKTETLFLRFNSYENRIEFARDDKSYAVDSGKINGFVFYASDGRIVFKNGFKSEKHDIDTSTLIRVIESGKISFVCYHKTDLKENLASYGSARKKNEFVDNRKYYFVTDDGTFHEIKKLKEKHVLGIFDDKKKEIKEYVRTNNLDYSKESDITRIVAFYNKQQAS